MMELDNGDVNKFESLGSILESKSTTHPEFGVGCGEGGGGGGGGCGEGVGGGRGCARSRVIIVKNTVV